MRFYDKYIVVKKDILTGDQVEDIYEVLDRTDNKSSFENKYLVVNEDEPYANIVRQLIESNDKNKNKLYEGVMELIEPRLMSDFCGYNEEDDAFDPLLALKEILETLEDSVKRLDEENQELRRRFRKVREITIFPTLVEQRK